VTRVLVAQGQALARTSIVALRYDGAILASFEVAYHYANRHGVLTAVHVPDTPEPVPDEVMQRLPLAEAELAQGMTGMRRVRFVAGRLALRRACEQVGASPPPILVGGRGAPSLPRGLAGSVSHKTSVAVGMVARAEGGTLGVDLTEYGPPRAGLASRVLTEDERAEIAGQEPAQHWISVLMRFSIKEAMYKSLDPLLNRYIGYQEVAVHPDVNGGVIVDLRLGGADGLEVDARYAWLHGRLLCSARAKHRDCG
jgi:enterobactin synthetase component D